jgi:hypothetical protein
MVGKRGMGLGVAVLALALSPGCVGPPEGAEARLAALEAEGREMDEALDTVEERLLGNQARLHLWQELGRRHKEVSAIHCQHADMHLAALLQHHEKQEEKARQLRKRRRVATVDSTVLTSGKAPQHSHN